MRKSILIANWKMNGSLHSNQALLVRMLAKLRPFRKTIDMAICPPFPYLFQVRDHGFTVCVGEAARDKKRLRVCTFPDHATGRGIRGAV